MRRFLVALLMVLPGSGLATTFIVPTDEQLIHQSDAIVTGVVVSNETVPSGDGIVTVARVAVDDTLKGFPQPRLDVIEEGGAVEGRGTWTHGTPRYEPGERVLLFLQRGDGPSYRTTDLLLGKFTWRANTLVRGSAEHGVFGLNGHGRPHVEPVRDGARFVDFIRLTATGHDSRPDYVVDYAAVQEVRVSSHAGAASYAMSPPARWNNGATASFLANANPGTAARALAAWTGDPASAVSYSFEGTSALPYGPADGRNSIVFNLPRSQFGGLIAVASTSTAGIHTYDGTAWQTIVEGDVRLSESVAGLSEATVDAIVAHELGHTLGLRHADAGSPNANEALMTSIVGNERGAVLGDWDRDALSHIYGSGATTCAPVMFMGGPVATPSVILTGQSAILSVNASGAMPLTYQWFAGNSGDTNFPVGGTPAVAVSPTVGMSYWVRVRNACGIGTDSMAVTVTVADAPPCIPAKIRTQPADVRIRSGEGAQLIIGMDGTAPFTFSWFEGPSGDTSRPLGRNLPFLTVAPATTTSYWVRARNPCSAGEDSTAAFVIVVTPQEPSFRRRAVGRR